MAHILIVDSDTMSAVLAAAVLRIDNHHVVATQTAADAFQIIRSREFVPHTIIIDPELKRISGFHLAASIRSRYPHIPILFMSDNYGISDVLESFVGVGNVIQKPLDALELRAAVRRRLKGRDRQKLVA